MSGEGVCRILKCYSQVIFLTGAYAGPPSRFQDIIIMIHVLLDHALQRVGYLALLWSVVTIVH